MRMITCARRAKRRFAAASAAAAALVLAATGVAAQEQTVEGAHDFLRLTMLRQDVRLNMSWPRDVNGAHIPETRDASPRVDSYDVISPCFAGLEAGGRPFNLPYETLTVEQTVWDRESEPPSLSSYVEVRSGARRAAFFASDDLVRRMYRAMAFLVRSCDPAEQTGF